MMKSKSRQRLRDAEWSESEGARKQYLYVRARAQEEANADGFDRGIERNDMFRSFTYRMLPRKENRYGHETRCEVVSCEDVSKTQPGHGYGR